MLFSRGSFSAAIFSGLFVLVLSFQNCGKVAFNRDVASEAIDTVQCQPNEFLSNEQCIPCTFSGSTTVTLSTQSLSQDGDVVFTVPNNPEIDFVEITTGTFDSSGNPIIINATAGEQVTYRYESANPANNFNGRIRVFKVERSCGAAESTFTIMYNRNASCTIGNLTANPNPIFVNQQTNLTYNFSNCNFTNGYQINWTYGDNTSTNFNNIATSTKSYAEPGSYDVSATIQSQDLSSPRTSNVTVNVICPQGSDWNQTLRQCICRSTQDPVPANNTCPSCDSFGLGITTIPLGSPNVGQCMCSAGTFNTTSHTCLCSDNLPPAGNPLSCDRTPDTPTCNSTTEDLVNNQCECKDGLKRSGAQCMAVACSGTIPANNLACHLAGDAQDNVSLSSHTSGRDNADITYRFVTSCSAAKCEFTCGANQFVNANSQCEVCPSGSSPNPNRTDCLCSDGQPPQNGSCTRTPASPTSCRFRDYLNGNSTVVTINVGTTIDRYSRSGTQCGQACNFRPYSCTQTEANRLAGGIAEPFDATFTFATPSTCSQANVCSCPADATPIVGGCRCNNTNATYNATTNSCDLAACGSATGQTFTTPPSGTELCSRGSSAGVNPQTRPNVQTTSTWVCSLGADSQLCTGTYCGTNQFRNAAGQCVSCPSGSSPNSTSTSCVCANTAATYNATTNSCDLASCGSAHLSNFTTAPSASRLCTSPNTLRVGLNPQTRPAVRTTGTWVCELGSDVQFCSGTWCAQNEIVSNGVCTPCGQNEVVSGNSCVCANGFERFGTSCVAICPEGTSRNEFGQCQSTCNTNYSNLLGHITPGVVGNVDGLCVCSSGPNGSTVGQGGTCAPCDGSGYFVCGCSGGQVYQGNGVCACGFENEIWDGNSCECGPGFVRDFLVTPVGTFPRGCRPAP